MGKRLLAIVFIFFCTTIAWVILGGTVENRTNNQDSTLREAVGQLWGSPQTQKAPTVTYQTTTQKPVQGQKPGTMYTETKTYQVPLEKSDLKVDLKLKHRKKGLLWYSTYRVNFDGNYQLINNTGAERTFVVGFVFPNQDAIYDDFKFVVGNQEMRDVKINDGRVTAFVKLGPNKSQNVRIAYTSQGLDEWCYAFGEQVTQVKNFSLVMNTSFKDINFPEQSISPTIKAVKTDHGYQCTWKYSNFLTGYRIGMEMPKLTNPGPWVATVSYFAPVSLFLFLFMIIIFSVMKGVKIHPVNYFFICAAYFSFHLLLAYLVDHISIYWALPVCSAVSIFLVISYMRIVVGPRFAFFEVGLSQFVFLVLFSCTFLLQGMTGLVITILSIITLFIAMQLTARVDWEDVFRDKKVEDNKLPINL